MKFNKDKLKAELLIQHITMKELAKRLGTTETTISRKMDGIAEWKQSDMKTIAEIIGKEKMVSIFFEDITA